MADINQLVGNKLPLQIPEVAVKWITYALVLHIVALAFAAVSAVFGLLAHVREMSMTCFSSCIAGFGATVALLAFIFDVALFMIARARLNKVKGGSASLGNGIWLTLAAWILLFFSGCFYGIGRCCIKRRPRNNWDGKKDAPGGEGGNAYGDQMRLDAVKAEADRKARQKNGEVGLPAFQEYDPSQPLRAKVDHDEVYGDEDDSSHYGYHNQAPVQATAYSGGYVQGTPGNRAIDEFNAPPSTSYPPQPNRQNSGRTQATTGYEGSQYGYGAGATAVPVATQQYLSTAPQDYGHAQGGTSCELFYPSFWPFNSNMMPDHSAASHQPYPSAQHDPYGAAQYEQQYDGYSSAPQPQQHYQDTGVNNTALLAAAGFSPHSTPSPYHQTTTSQPERNYTLGGGNYDSGYGANQVPDHTQHGDTQFFPSPYQNHPDPPHPLSTSPAPINTNVAALPGPTNTSPVKGPRGMGSPIHQYNDSPPGYDNGLSHPPGAWGEKR